MPGKILIVDDDPDTLKLIGLMLKRQGYEVATVGSGQAALEHVRQQIPELIILDVMMPEMDGYQVAGHLRGNPQTENIPILMFTAKNLVDDKVAGFEAGADAYLTKPTHPDELAAQVKALLARSAAQGQPAAEQPVASAPAPTSRGLTYAFIGVKGGVGLSTLAMNVGAVLAEHETTTLADFRLGRGTIGMSLGFGRSMGMANLLGLSAQEINIDSVRQEIATHECGLNLLLSSARSREVQVKVAPETARNIVGALVDLSKHVLLDLGPGLNPLTINFARDVDRVIFAVEATPVALAMGYDMLTELRQVGVSREKTSVVIINRAESKSQIPWQDAEQHLDNEVMAVISAVPELAHKGMEQNRPMILVNPNAMIHMQFNKLAEELVRRTVGN